jgi:hypothetical protein
MKNKLLILLIIYLFSSGCYKFLPFPSNWEGQMQPEGRIKGIYYKRALNFTNINWGLEADYQDSILAYVYSDFLSLTDSTHYQDTLMQNKAKPLFNAMYPLTERNAKPIPWIGCSFDFYISLMQTGKFIKYHIRMEDSAFLK